MMNADLRNRMVEAGWLADNDSDLVIVETEERKNGVHSFTLITKEYKGFRMTNHPRRGIAFWPHTDEAIQIMLKTGVPQPVPSRQYPMWMDDDVTEENLIEQIDAQVE